MHENVHALRPLSEAHSACLELQQHVAHLERALRNRPVIETAKGVVMAYRGCDAAEAFTVMRKLSNDHNVKVGDIACAVNDVAVSGGVNTPADLHCLVVDYLLCPDNALSQGLFRPAG